MWRWLVPQSKCPFYKPSVDSCPAHSFFYRHHFWIFMAMAYLHHWPSWGKMWNGSGLHQPSSWCRPESWPWSTESCLRGGKPRPSRCLINKCLPSECAISAVYLPPCTAENCISQTNHFRSWAEVFSCRPLKFSQWKYCTPKKVIIAAVLI